MKPILTQEYLKTMFDYKDGHLYWKEDRLVVRKGEKAGTLNNCGYMQVGHKGNVYLLHRLIFTWHHGYLPKYVDHINNDRADNRIENLREATSAENNYNRKKRTTKYPVKGIYKHSKFDKYCVELYCKGKRIHIGIFKTLEEAMEASKKAREKYHGKFARHN